MKKCNKCKKLKNKSEFHKDKKAKDGLHSWCISCISIHDKKCYQANKEKIKQENKKYYQENKEKVKNNYKINKEKIKLADKKRAQNNPESYLLQQAKGNAKFKFLEFNLTMEDIVIPEYCSFLGVKLDKVYSKGRYTPSIDRIDNSKGYIKGNVQIISWLANRMKQNSTREELLAFSESVKRIYTAI